MIAALSVGAAACQCCGEAANRLRPVTVLGQSGSVCEKCEGQILWRKGSRGFTVQELNLLAEKWEAASLPIPETHVSEELARKLAELRPLISDLTPGPWSAEGNEIRSAGGGTICFRDGLLCNQDAAGIVALVNAAHWLLNFATSSEVFADELAKSHVECMELRRQLDGLQKENEGLRLTVRSAWEREDRTKARLRSILAKLPEGMEHADG